jgi:hypothetical protein
MAEKPRRQIGESDNRLPMAAPAKDSLLPSHLIELGQQAIKAVAAKVMEGAPLVRCQLLASDFFEAWKQHHRASEHDFPRYELLTAVGFHCFRMRTAAISPATMLQELEAAVEMLRSERLPDRQRTRSRPVLRVIEGGLSR